MNVPSIPVQLLIAALGLVLVPVACGVVVVLLAKLHLLPLALFLGVTKFAFPNWMQNHPMVWWIFLGLCTGYAVLMWGLRIFRWCQEERYARGILLARAMGYENEPVNGEDETRGIEED